MTPSDSAYCLIPLTRDQKAIVDRSDFSSVMQWKWQARWNPHTRSYYASRHDESHPNRNLISMQRFILGLRSGDPRKADHINGDTLDNRRSNLRIATNAGNGQNARRKINNTSGFKGVHLRKDLGKWTARICVNRKRIHLGHFPTPEQAFEAYRQAAIKMHGEYARTQ